MKNHNNSLTETFVKIHAQFLAINSATRTKIIAIFFISCTLLLVFYWYSYRPMAIKKQCASVQYVDSWDHFNLYYNEIAEKQKRKKLGEYIQCRNNSILEGDSVLPLNYSFTFTRDQYDTLSLDNITRRVLGTRPDMLYAVYLYDYSGGFITNDWYADLKENKNKYPQCDFPEDFISKKTYGSDKRTRDASDQEYKSCLRKNGVDNS